MTGQTAGKGNASPPAALKKAIEKPPGLRRRACAYQLRLGGKAHPTGKTTTCMFQAADQPGRLVQQTANEGGDGAFACALLGGQPVETRLVATPSFGRRRLLLTSTSSRPAPPPRSLERGQFARVLTSRRVGGHHLAARIPSLMHASSRTVRPSVGRSTVGLLPDVLSCLPCPCSRLSVLAGDVGGPDQLGRRRQASVRVQTG